LLTLSGCMAAGADSWYTSAVCVRYRGRDRAVGATSQMLSATLIAVMSHASAPPPPSETDLYSVKRCWHSPVGVA